MTDYEKEFGVRAIQVKSEVFRIRHEKRKKKDIEVLTKKY